MSNCHHCGITLPSNAIYCPSCGYKVTAESCCPNCQYPVRSTDRFCMKCGLSLEHSETELSRPSQIFSKDNRIIPPFMQDPIDKPFGEDRIAVPLKENPFNAHFGSITCPSCHAILPDTNRICPECGTMLSPSRKKQYHKTDIPEDIPPVSSHIRRKTVTIIVIVGILLFFLLAWTLTQRHISHTSFSPGNEMQVPAEEVIDNYNIPTPLPSAAEEEDTNGEEDLGN